MTTGVLAMNARGILSVAFAWKYTIPTIDSRIGKIFGLEERYLGGFLLGPEGMS